MESLPESLPETRRNVDIAFGPGVRYFWFALVVVSGRHGQSTDQ